MNMFIFTILLILMLISYINSEKIQCEGYDMIDLKSIVIDSERVIGLQIKMPFTLLIFVFNTKGFLCGNQINIESFNHSKAAVCIMSKSSTYDECLTSEVKALNQSALDKGIEIGMKGKKALMMMHEV